MCRINLPLPIPIEMAHLRVATFKHVHSTIEPLFTEGPPNIPIHPQDGPYEETAC